MALLGRPVSLLVIVVMVVFATDAVTDDDGLPVASAAVITFAILVIAIRGLGSRGRGR
jgi:hypothetical protein